MRPLDDDVPVLDQRRQIEAAIMQRRDIRELRSVGSTIGIKRDRHLAVTSHRRMDEVGQIAGDIRTLQQV